MREISQHSSRIQKILEDANLKLGSVLSDVLGQSGPRDPQSTHCRRDRPGKLADLARGTARKKRSELIEALHWRIRAHHRGLLKVHLELVGALGAHRFSVEAVLAADTADSLCASRPLLGIAAADRAEANAQTISVPFSMTGPACHPASAYSNDGPDFRLRLAACHWTELPPRLYLSSLGRLKP